MNVYKNIGHAVEELEFSECSNLIHTVLANSEFQAVKDEIQELKDDSIAKTNQVNEELIQQISVRKLQLEEIKREEKAEISRRKGLIDSEIEALRQQYESSIKMFEEKDKETEKIYDYEGRIYQLALDTAESKYRETVNKAKKATTILGSGFLQFYLSL